MIALSVMSDAIVNCAVMRPDRRLAFGVNVLGTYNAISAAVAAGHRRFINTGPHFSIVGQTYEDFVSNRVLLFTCEDFVHPCSPMLIDLELQQ